MDQNVNVGEPPLEQLRRRRCDQCDEDRWWARDVLLQGNGVNRRQCEKRRIVIVNRQAVRDRRREHAVRLRVAMNNDVVVPLVLSFVNVFGWSDGKNSQSDRQRTCDSPSRVHRRMLRDRRLKPQLNSR